MIQQNTIWQHFISGRLSIEWGMCIRQHIKHQKITGLTQEKCGAKVSAINWKL